MEIITTHTATMNKLHNNPIRHEQLLRDGAEVLLFTGIHHISVITELNHTAFTDEQIKQ